MRRVSAGWHRVARPGRHLAVWGLAALASLFVAGGVAAGVARLASSTATSTTPSVACTVKTSTLTVQLTGSTTEADAVALVTSVVTTSTGSSLDVSVELGGSVVSGCTQGVSGLSSIVLQDANSSTGSLATTEQFLTVDEQAGALGTASGSTCTSGYLSVQGATSSTAPWSVTIDPPESTATTPEPLSLSDSSAGIDPSCTGDGLAVTGSTGTAVAPDAWIVDDAAAPSGVTPVPVSLDATTACSPVTLVADPNGGDTFDGPTGSACGSGTSPTGTLDLVGDSSACLTVTLQPSGTSSAAQVVSSSGSPSCTVATGATPAFGAETFKDVSTVVAAQAPTDFVLTGPPSAPLALEGPGFVPPGVLESGSWPDGGADVANLSSYGSPLSVSLSTYGDGTVTPAGAKAPTVSLEDLGAVLGPTGEVTSYSVHPPSASSPSRASALPLQLVGQSGSYGTSGDSLDVGALQTAACGGTAPQYCATISMTGAPDPSAAPTIHAFPASPLGAGENTVTLGTASSPAVEFAGIGEVTGPSGGGTEFVTSSEGGFALTGGAAAPNTLDLASAVLETGEAAITVDTETTPPLVSNLEADAAAGTTDSFTNFAEVTASSVAPVTMEANGKTPYEFVGAIPQVDTLNLGDAATTATNPLLVGVDSSPGSATGFSLPSGLNCPPGPLSNPANCGEASDGGGAITFQDLQVIDGANQTSAGVGTTFDLSGVYPASLALTLAGGGTPADNTVDLADVNAAPLTSPSSDVPLLGVDLGDAGSTPGGSLCSVDGTALLGGIGAGSLGGFASPCAPSVTSEDQPVTFTGVTNVEQSTAPTQAVPAPLSTTQSTTVPGTVFVLAGGNFNLSAASTPGASGYSAAANGVNFLDLAGASGGTSISLASTGTVGFPAGSGGTTTATSSTVSGVFGVVGPTAGSSSFTFGSTGGYEVFANGSDATATNTLSTAASSREKVAGIFQPAGGSAVIAGEQLTDSSASGITDGGVFAAEGVSAPFGVATSSDFLQGFATIDGANNGYTTLAFDNTTECANGFGSPFAGGISFVGHQSGNVLDLSGVTLCSGDAVQVNLDSSPATVGNGPSSGGAPVFSAPDSFTGITQIEGTADGGTSFVLGDTAGYTLVAANGGVPAGSSTLPPLAPLANVLDLSAAGASATSPLVADVTTQSGCTSPCIPASGDTGVLSGGALAPASQGGPATDQFSGITSYLGSTDGQTDFQLGAASGVPLAGGVQITGSPGTTGNVLDLSGAPPQLVVSTPGGPSGPSSVTAAPAASSSIGVTPPLLGASISFSGLTTVKGSSSGYTTFSSAPATAPVGGYTFVGGGQPDTNALDFASSSAGVTFDAGGSSTAQVNGLAVAPDDFSGIAALVGSNAGGNQFLLGSQSAGFAVVGGTGSSTEEPNTLDLSASTADVTINATSTPGLPPALGGSFATPPAPTGTVAFTGVSGTDSFFDVEAFVGANSVTNTLDASAAGGLSFTGGGGTAENILSYADAGSVGVDVNAGVDPGTVTGLGAPEGPSACALTTAAAGDCFTGVTSFVGGSGANTFQLSTQSAASFSGGGSTDSTAVVPSVDGAVAVDLAATPATVALPGLGGGELVDTLTGVQNVDGPPSGDTTFTLPTGGGYSILGEATPSALPNTVDLAGLPSSQADPTVVDLSGNVPYASCPSAPSGTTLAGYVTWQVANAIPTAQCDALLGDLADFDGPTAGHAVFVPGAAGGYSFAAPTNAAASVLDLAALGTGSVVNLDASPRTLTLPAGEGTDTFVGLRYLVDGTGTTFAVGPTTGYSFVGDAFQVGGGPIIPSGEQIPIDPAAGGDTLDLANLGASATVQPPLGASAGTVSAAGGSDTFDGSVTTFDGPSVGGSVFYAVPRSAGQAGLTFDGASQGNVLDLADLPAETGLAGQTVVALGATSVDGTQEPAHVAQSPNLSPNPAVTGGACAYLACIADLSSIDGPSDPTDFVAPPTGSFTIAADATVANALDLSAATGPATVSMGANGDGSAGAADLTVNFTGVTELRATSTGTTSVQAPTSTTAAATPFLFEGTPGAGDGLSFAGLSDTTGGTGGQLVVDTQPDGTATVCSPLPGVVATSSSCTASGLGVATLPGGSQELFTGVSQFDGAQSGFTDFELGNQAGIDVQGSEGNNAIDLSQATGQLAVNLATGTVSGGGLVLPGGAEASCGAPDCFSGMSGIAGSSGGTSFDGSATPGLDLIGVATAPGGAPVANELNFAGLVPGGSSGVGVSVGETAPALQGNLGWFAPVADPTAVDPGPGDGTVLLPGGSGADSFFNVSSFVGTPADDTFDVGAGNYQISGDGAVAGGQDAVVLDDPSAAGVVCAGPSGSTAYLVNAPQDCATMTAGTLPSSDVAGSDTLAGIGSITGTSFGQNDFAVVGSGAPSLDFAGRGTGNILDLSGAGGAVTFTPSSGVATVADGSPVSFSDVTVFVAPGAGGNDLVAPLTGALSFCPGTYDPAAAPACAPAASGSTIPANTLDLTAVPLATTVTMPAVGPSATASCGDGMLGSATTADASLVACFADVQTLDGAAGGTTVLAGPPSGLTFAGDPSIASANTLSYAPDTTAVPGSGSVVATVTADAAAGASGSVSLAGNAIAAPDVFSGVGSLLAPGTSGSNAAALGGNELDLAGVGASGGGQPATIAVATGKASLSGGTATLGFSNFTQFVAPGTEPTTFLAPAGPNEDFVGAPGLADTLSFAAVPGGLSPLVVDTNTASAATLLDGTTPVPHVASLPDGGTDGFGAIATFDGDGAGATVFEAGSATNPNAYTFDAAPGTTGNVLDLSASDVAGITFDLGSGTVADDAAGVTYSVRGIQTFVGTPAGGNDVVDAPGLAPVGFCPGTWSAAGATGGTSACTPAAPPSAGSAAPNTLDLSALGSGTAVTMPGALLPPLTTSCAAGLAGSTAGGGTGQLCFADVQSVDGPSAGGMHLLATTPSGDTFDASGGGSTPNSLSYAASPVGLTLDAYLGLASAPGGSSDSFAGFQDYTGSPADNLFVAGPGTESLDGGGGVDTVSFADAPAAVTTDLLTGQASGGWGTTITLSGIQNVIASDYGDTIIGNKGPSSFTGGPGNDTFVLEGGNDSIDGGGGTNTLDLGAATGPVSLTLGVNDLPQDTGSLGEVSVVPGTIQRVVGGNLGNVLVAANGDATLVGGAGTDVLAGGSGSVTLEAGSGTATLVGGTGPTVMTGGAGADTYIPLTGPVTVTGGTGSNTLDYAGDPYPVEANLSSSVFVVPAIPTLPATPGNANPLPAPIPQPVPAGTVVPPDEVVGGYAPTATASVTGVQDILGTNGNDVLVAGESGATLTGGTGTDLLGAGPGVTDVTFDAGGRSVIEPGTGSDAIACAPDGAAGSGCTVDFQNVDAAVTVDLGSGLATVASTSTSPAASDQLSGVLDAIGAPAPYEDVLTAGQAGSILFGGGGSDTLTAAPAGNDVLVAGSSFGATGSGQSTLEAGIGGHSTLVDTTGLASFFASQSGSNYLLGSTVFPFDYAVVDASDTWIGFEPSRVQEVP